MIRHLVVFSFQPDTPEDVRQALLDELRTFPERFGAMTDWTMGANRSQRDDTFEWAFVVDFAAEEELLAYLNSEAHERFVTEVFRPVIARRAIVSFEV